ncbi:MAG: hypothetical protein IBJ18_10500 [Phycisphaerales bacterium]|nr:hypothetical protein [Phycisphaerales bacterium]
MPHTSPNTNPLTQIEKHARVPRRLFAFALTALAFAFAALTSPTLPTAHAANAAGRQSQPATPQESKAGIEFIRFGLGDTVTESRWNQLAVTVRGGTEAQNLRLIITTPNDTTQNATYTRGFSTTPGVNTTVIFNIFFSASSNIVKVELRGEGVNETVDVQRFAGEASIVNNYSALEPGKPSVLCLTSQSTLPTIPTEFAKLFEGPNPSSLKSVPFVTIRPDELPTSHLALDGFSLLILRAEQLDSLAIRQRFALSRWLNSGGSLVLITTQPASAWSSLLDLEELSAGLLNVNAVSTDTPGLASAFADLFTGLDQPPQPRAGLPVRTISLTPRARTLGWLLRGKLPSDPNTGLVASGPVGFGRLTILGFDAVSAESDIAFPRVARNLKHIFTTSLELIPRYTWDPASRPPNQPFGSAFNRWGPESTAKNAAVSSLAVVTPMGSGVIWAFVIFGLALAVMVGPGDLMLLKALRQSHRSWVSALVWIFLACCAGYFIPPMIRAAPTSANRLEVIDSISLPKQSFNACTGVCTIFAGGPVNDNLTGYHQTATAVGISASFDRERRASITLPSLNYRPNDDTTSVPTSFELRSWTLRSFQDNWTSSDPTFTPTLTTDPSTQKLRLTLPQLPAGARISSAVLRTLRSDIALVAAGADASRANELVEFERQDQKPTRSLFQNVQNFAGNITNLHPIGRREESINLRVRSGHFGLLLLRIENLPPTVKLQGAEISTRTVYLRAVVQLPVADQPSDDAPITPPLDPSQPFYPGFDFSVHPDPTDSPASEFPS